MDKIPEKFLHYLWKHRLFDENNFFSEAGESIEVVDTGLPNMNSGPDFLNASIKIGHTLWVGNVEIHVKSSDWNHHGHNHDKTYNNVILQAVLNNNATVKRTTGEPIVTGELKFDPILFKNYQYLLKNESWIACEKEINKIDLFVIDFWLSRLTIERLEIKSEQIQSSLAANHNHWETTFYHKLAQNFGFKVNSQPFESLAQLTPLSIINHHRDSLFQLESLFFGQAGFLDQKTLHDPYHRELFDEYHYLKHKWKLKALESHIWKFGRLRPNNFPTLRIAQFCKLMYQSNRLFSHILEKRHLDELKKLFVLHPSDYWKTHYHFNKRTQKKPNNLGVDAFHILVINTIVPFLFLYGHHQNKQQYKERALEFLLSLPAEKNSIINRWRKLGIHSHNAYQTQALLQLKNHYCSHKRCLECQIGNTLIKKTSNAK